MQKIEPANKILPGVILHQVVPEKVMYIHDFSRADVTNIMAFAPGEDHGKLLHPPRWTNQSSLSAKSKLMSLGISTESTIWTDQTRWIPS